MGSGGGGGVPNKLLPFGGGGLYSVVGFNPVGGGYDAVWYGGGGVVVVLVAEEAQSRVD